MKRAILLFTVVVFCFLLTSCEETSGSLPDDATKETVSSAIKYYWIQDEAMKEYNIPYGDDSTIGLYYTEEIYPFSLSKSFLDFNYVDAYDPKTKYEQTIPDFEDALEWYKYSYDSGTLSPDSSYKQDLDMWVNYYTAHPESIPVVTGKKNADGLLKYVQKKTGHSSYSPDEDAFGITNIRKTYIIFKTDDKYYTVCIYGPDYLTDVPIARQFDHRLMNNRDVDLENAVYFNPNEFSEEIIHMLDNMEEVSQQQQ